MALIKSDLEVKSICLAKLKRLGLHIEKIAHTHIFEEDENYIPQRINNNVILDAFELPIILCYISKDSWFLLTSRKIHFRNSEGLSVKFFSELQRIEPGMFKRIGNNLTEIMKLIFRHREIHRIEYEVGQQQSP